MRGIRSLSHTLDKEEQNMNNNGGMGFCGIVFAVFCGIALFALIG